MRAPEGLGWDAFAQWGVSVHAIGWTELLAQARDRLLDRIASAVEQPLVFPLTEDYTVFRVDRLLDAEGKAFPPDELHDGEVSRLLLGERRPLTNEARKELLSPRLGYFADDLVVLCRRNRADHDRCQRDARQDPACLLSTGFRRGGQAVWLARPGRACTHRGRRRLGGCTEVDEEYCGGQWM